MIRVSTISSSRRLGTLWNHQSKQQWQRNPQNSRSFFSFSGSNSDGDSGSSGSGNGGSDDNGKSDGDSSSSSSSESDTSELGLTALPKCPTPVPLYRRDVDEDEVTPPDEDDVVVVLRARAACCPPRTPAAANTAWTTSPSRTTANSFNLAASGANKRPLQINRKYLPRADGPNASIVISFRVSTVSSNPTLTVTISVPLLLGLTRSDIALPFNENIDFDMLFVLVE
mmetsp:Transcript_8827/g.13551  ORF Transcript_8827/g.13551 Transcript_8827/m.13551 type:complete len:227 (-) Transcript_8827:625-1305(-)